MRPRMRVATIESGVGLNGASKLWLFYGEHVFKFLIASLMRH